MLLFLLSAFAGSTLADFSWLEGTWRGSKDKVGLLEESWSGPLGDTMMARIRFLKDEKALGFEMIVLRQEADSVRLYIHRYSKPDERGLPLWDFDVESVEKNKAVFVNEKRDEKIYYTRSENALRIEVHKPDKKKGRTVLEFDLDRVYGP